MVDIRDQASIEAACSDITQRLNGRGLNLLINNAGIAVFHTLYEATVEDMMEMYTTNTIGPMLVTQVEYFTAKVVSLPITQPQKLNI